MYSWSVYLSMSAPPFTRLAKHLTALRAWCTRCLPDRRKPAICHAPSRQCRDARDYTTIWSYGSATHEMSTPPPPTPYERRPRFERRTDRPPKLKGGGLTRWLTARLYLNKHIKVKRGLDAPKMARPRFDHMTDRPRTLKTVCQGQKRP